jgi:glutamate-1-semialdehyde 2,1-aminomutase
MAVFDPRISGSVSHSGTFNNNTLVTHAGYVGLTQVYTTEAAVKFAQTGDELLQRLNDVTAGTKLCFTGLGTLISAHFVQDGRREIRRGGDVEENLELLELFWFEMLENGFWIARRGNIAFILETPQSELDRFVSAVQDFVTTHKDLVASPSH